MKDESCSFTELKTFSVRNTENLRDKLTLLDAFKK